MQHEVPKKKITAEGLKNAFKLYSYIRPYRGEYILGLFFLLGSSIASLAFPKLLGDLVNSGSSGKLADDINMIAFLLILTLTVQAVFSYFRVVIFVNVTEKTLAFLRQHTYNHLITLPIRFFEKHRVGELNSRISSDISLLQETLTYTLAEFIREIIIITGGITLLAITSLKLTLFMLAILPGMILLAVFFGRFIRKYSKRMQKEVAESNTIVEETLQGIQIVKVYTNEYHEMDRYRTRTNEIAKIGIKGGKYRGAFSAFMILGLFGAMVAVIWKGSVMMSDGLLASGDLFSFVIYSGFVGGTIGGLAGTFTQIQKFIGATEELFEIFDEKEEKLSKVDELSDGEKLAGSIKFENLTFTYPSRPDEVVLNNVNFEIPENQMVALVGASGAGKSTIATLLLKLHEPSSGSIFSVRRTAGISHCRC
jgi:ABC-type multidrug transport system fused ATPase/permease subunit